MAEKETTKAAETDQTKTEETTPQGEATEETTDWKAEARKWERRAKENVAKAEELDRAQAASKTTEEKVSELQAKLDAYETAQARESTVAKVAKDAGLPKELVSMLSATDADELAAQAAQLKDAIKKPSAPKDTTSGKFATPASDPDSEKKRFVADLFGRN